MNRGEFFDQLRCVVVRYINSPDDSFEKNDDDTQFHLHKDDIKDFIISLIKLHVNPGVNPYNEKKPFKIKMISIYAPSHGKYWWTSPDLSDINKSVDVINQWILDKHIYLCTEIHKNYLITLYEENESNSYAADPENFSRNVQEYENLSNCEEYICEDYKQYI